MTKDAVLDVRKPGEFEASHLKESISMPLDFINDQMDKLSKEIPYYVHCAGGYRSMIFSSILRARGFDQLTDVQGGYEAIQKTHLPSTEFVCVSTK